MFKQAEWNLTEKKNKVKYSSCQKTELTILKSHFMFFLLLFQGLKETNLENEEQEFNPSQFATC